MKRTNFARPRDVITENSVDLPTRARANRVLKKTPRTKRIVFGKR